MCKAQQIEERDAEYEVGLTRQQCILLLTAYDDWYKRFYGVHISKRKTLTIYTSLCDFHYRTVDALIKKGHIKSDYGMGYRLTKYGIDYVRKYYDSVAYQVVSTRGTESWDGQPQIWYTWGQIIELMDAGEFALAQRAREQRVRNIN